MSDVTDTQTPDISAEPVETIADEEARTPSQLEEEGDIAADYIEELLDITDLDGDKVTLAAGQQHLYHRVQRQIPQDAAIKLGA